MLNGPKFHVIERITHLLHVISLIFLVTSGWYIWSPDTCPFFRTMSGARLIHFISMYIFTFLGLFHTYFFFITKRHKTDSFKPSDIKDIPFEMKSRYLLLVGEDGKFVERYSPLEKFVYEIIFIVAAVQVVNGFVLYWYAHPTGIGLIDRLVLSVAGIFGGIQYIRMWHLVISFFFVWYMAVHIYFILTEDARAILEMTIGRRHLKERSCQP